MKKILPFLLPAALLLTIATGCSSTGYSGGSSSYYHRNAWEYDNYYRTGVNHYYNRPEARANARARASDRSGGAIRTGGGRGGRR